jgi:hypothetical protein
LGRSDLCLKLLFEALRYSGTLEAVFAEVRRWVIGWSASFECL